MSITSPDDRTSTYNPVVPTTEFPATFPIFDNDDLIVIHNGEERDDFAVSATYVEGISTDAKAVFGAGITGEVKVVGSRAPRRTNRFKDGAPLPIRDQNLALDTVEAEVQELSRDRARALKVAYGADAQDVPAPEVGKVLGWSSAGKLVNLLLSTTGLVAFGLKGIQLAATNTLNDALAALGLPTIQANRMLVDNADGSARESKTFTEVVELLGLTYIKDYGSKSIALRKFRPGGVVGGDPSDWTATLQAAANSAEPCIRVHADSEIPASGQWTIDFSQKWVSDGADNKPQIRRTTVANEPFIIVRSERSGMRNIGVKCNSNVGATSSNVGILVARPSGQPTDLDFTFDGGYISGFYYLSRTLGRGATFVNSVLSDARYCVDWDWPAAGTFVKDRFVGDSDTNGFRRLRLAGCEFHSIEVAGVRNRGANAANAHFVIENNYSNFGKAIFVGHLGDGSVIQGNLIQNANFVGFELDGGTNWVMQNNSIYADRTVGGFPEPDNFLRMTGQHTGFVIDGFRARGCTGHGIDMRSGDFVGILRNIDLAAIGSAAVATSDGVIVIGTGANTEILVDGVTLRNASAARSVVRMNTAGSVLKHRAIVALGAATPATSGLGTFTAV